MLRNLCNYMLSLTIIYFLTHFVPLLYYVFTAFSVGWIGLKLAGWLMTITRRLILYKKICPKDKAVLITGCDTGFGNELASRMDYLGYKVYACCLDPNGEGARKLSNESSEKLTVLPLNVVDDKSVHAVKEFIARDLRQNILWAVVNNAGITHWSQVDWTSVEEIQRVYEVNATGTLRVTKAVLPFLKKSRGRIINVASISGRFPFPVFVGYCMSKSAVIALTTSLRIELAKWGVKAITIEPSFYSDTQNKSVTVVSLSNNCWSARFKIRTPLVTVEASLATADRIWKTAPKEIKEEYGEEYMQALKKYIRKCLEVSCNPNRSEVIDCLEDAITAEDPLSTYFPCSLSHRILVSLLLSLPNAVKECIHIKLLEYGAKPLALTLNKKEK